MLFKNIGEPVKVRVQEVGGFRWLTLRKGQTLELPEYVGLAYGFERAEEVVEKPKRKVTKGKVHKKKQVETKQFEDKLLKVKGLGKKTAQDLMNIYPNEQGLRKAIQKGKEVPVRDDIAKLLKKKFK